jgi:acetyl esterase/lipase
LSYPNIGAFFARQGLITIVPDYRLASPPMSAKYPKPVEDIRDAVQWIIANRDKLISRTTPNPCTDNIFMFGHSAGAVHLSTLLLEPEVLAIDSPLRSKIRGVILNAGYYYYDSRSQLDEPFRLYYGDKQESHSALALLNSAKTKGLHTLPNILLGESEWDPPIVEEIRKKFRNDLETFLQRPIKHMIAKGHNHISIGAALSSGQGEEWAMEMIDWMRSIV